jgi:oxygen-independent coproporphyrinogen III oxidase
MPALYVHVPFCEHKCIYCDFYSIETFDLHAAYLDAVTREIAMRSRELAAAVNADASISESSVSESSNSTAPFTSVFLGGGTPSLLTSDELARVLGALRGNFAIAEDAEITVECNPGTVDRAKLDGFRREGVNRLSFGVQSFHADDLAFLTRIHSAEDAERAVREARAAGFENVNVDLMFSLPGQTPARWRENLVRALDLGTTHLSCYSLTVERGTKLAAMFDKGLVTLPGEESDADLFELTMEMLAAAGMRHYEVSNYAMPGYECRHNLTYWRHEEYLGFGPSAHGTWRGHRSWNVSSLGAYVEQVASDVLPVAGGEDLTQEMLREEYIYLRLRSEGIVRGEFRSRFGGDVVEENAALVARCLREGLLVLDGDVLRLTPAGFTVCDEICTELN